MLARALGVRDEDAEDDARDVYPGWLGEFVDASAAHTEAHPACIGIHLLIGLGKPGRPRPARDGERHAARVNEFAMVVGPTQIGRKGDGRNLAFAPLDPSRRAMAGRPGLSSGEG